MSTNTSTSRNKPIQINIGKNNELEVVEEKYNEFKDYIIRNNVSLHSEIKAQALELSALKQDLINKENIEDSYDNKMRYLKSLLQNLNELRNDYVSNTKKSEQQTTIIKDLNKNRKKNYFEIYVYLIILNILTIATPFHMKHRNIYHFFLQTIYFTYIPYCFMKIKKLYYDTLNKTQITSELLKTITQEISEIKANIKKTEDSCLSLDNWIHEV